MINSENYHFEIWKRKHEKLCNALQGEQIEGIELLELLYHCQRDVDSMVRNKKPLDNKLQNAVKRIEKLQRINQHLEAITTQLIKNNKISKAEAITSYSVQLDNGSLKWGKLVLVNYVQKMRKQEGEDYLIPEIIATPVWQKIQHCIVPKLCLWHIAFLINPYSVISSGRKRKQIMMDLYDAIQSGVLKANTTPPRIPKMIDEGQTIDRWEIHINDFEEAIDNGYLRSYFSHGLNLWKSYLAKRSQGLGRLENPEPLLNESLVIRGEGKKFYSALGENLKKQKGVKDNSKAFQEAMYQVANNNSENYRIYDALDEYEEKKQDAYIVKEQSVQENSLEQDDKTENDVAWRLKEGKGEVYDFFEDAYRAFLRKYKKQPRKSTLWHSLINGLLPDYDIKYDKEKELITFAGRALRKENFYKHYNKYLPK